MTKDTESTKFALNLSFQRSASFDIADGLEFEYKSDGRRVKITRARLTFWWDFKNSVWKGTIKVYVRWFLKNGSLGKDEHEAYYFRETVPEFEDFRRALLEEHRPRTIVTYTETPAEVSDGH